MVQSGRIFEKSKCLSTFVQKVIKLIVRVFL
jgi:hypothetical protein